MALLTLYLRVIPQDVIVILLYFVVPQ